jgi:(p)ppGpp synthase/HD superfamily hydrolase
MVNSTFWNRCDKGGSPYIFHLAHVAGQFHDLDAQTVALLHDIVEDTECTLEALRDVFEYPEHIIEAVDAITKREGESYTTYLKRVKVNELATRVKIADVKHNMDVNRIPNLDLKAARRHYQKYEKALRFLTGKTTDSEETVT